MKLKKYSLIVLLLVLLQLIRICIKKLVFLFIKHNVFTDVVVNTGFTIIAIICLLVLFKKRKISLDFFNIKHKKLCIVLTALLAIFIIATPFITKKFDVYSLIALVYNGILTVIYEEIIFRGFIYKIISNDDKEIVAYIVTAILFGLWHLGYVDTIIWRTSIFRPGADIPNIMIMKVITGCALGIVLGFLRYKNKNVYSSAWLHTLINVIGS